MGDEQQIPGRLADIQETLRKLVERDAKLESLIEQIARDEQKRSRELDEKVQRSISAAGSNQKRVEALEGDVRALKTATKRLEELAGAANERSHGSVHQLEGISNGLKAHLERERIAREARAERADKAIGALVKGFDTLTTQSKKGSYSVIAVLLVIEFFSVVFPEVTSLYRFHVEHSHPAEVR